MKKTIMMLLVAAVGFGQQKSLSDDEVKLALSGKGRDHAVILDRGSGKLYLYMPEAYLAMRSELAKEQFGLAPIFETNS